MDKEQTAIMRLQQASEMSFAVYEQPLMICHSGGKDSVVLAELARRAGVPYELSHSHTTADAPETVRFVRSEFQRISDTDENCKVASIVYPYYKGVLTSMWSLVPQKKMPPTRIVRYCCSILKETAGKNRFVATGVRWDESTSRKNGRGIFETQHRDKEKRVLLRDDNDDTRLLFENCRLKARRSVNPIIDWSDDDVWGFISEAHAAVNPVYEMGCDRAGCVGCPMAGKHDREREFMIWPAYKKAYIRAFDRLVEAEKQQGLSGAWTTGEDVFNWWMEYDILPGQMSFDDKENDE